MAYLLELPLALALLGQAATDDDARFAAGSAARLAYMERSARSWDVRPADGPARPFRLLAEPVLRFTNPVGSSRDGTVFLWVDQDGRPEAVVQASLNRQGAWVHELSSLTTRPLRAATDRGHTWSPSRGGVELRPMPDAPKPAPTAVQRLGQMRELAGRFALEDDFRYGGWQSLRMLPKPFARYGEEGTALVDGVLLCFVLTTDPEAYLMLEVRDGEGGPAWHYALAPSTVYPLRATLGGRTVWERSRAESKMGPTQPLHQLTYGTEEVGVEPKAP